MASVSRVLPWRRTSALLASQISVVLKNYRKHWPRANTKTITRAYSMAIEAHEGARRLTGEEYIQHPVAVASVVAEHGLDDIAIAAALLHDAVEDTDLELIDLRREFNDDLASIVDGVTKLARIRFDSKRAQQAATLRKMLVAIARDRRVLAIKLADRLHNMRTIGVMENDKQLIKARETLDIYAPLANRLGMQELRNELEDLSFATIYPKRYAEIDSLIADRTPQQEAYMDQLLEQVRTQLSKAKIGAKVTGRSKHHWSVYEKMVSKGCSFDEIFDLVGIRLVVQENNDCYAALGSIHSIWKPVSGRFKDYVAMPKSNQYQALHTTVIGPEGNLVEVQIRTDEMEQRAEHGLAAHWLYKSKDGQPDADIPWLDRVVAWHGSPNGSEDDATDAAIDDPDGYITEVATDLATDEVYVFTPAGDVMTLPSGSTPVDFAYMIHTDMGNSLIGAKVNGRLAPLDRALESGEAIEVFTSKDEDARPAREWLDFVVTPRARSNIRRHFARSDREALIESGRAAIEEAMNDEGLQPGLLFDTDEMVAVASQFGRSDQEMLFEAVGKADVEAAAVAQRMVNCLSDGSASLQLPALPTRFRGDRQSHRAAAVRVDGYEDKLVRMAQCCQPQQGDEILGLTTSGGGVTVHRYDCATAVEQASKPHISHVEVEWEQGRASDTLVMLEVRGLNRNKLLGDVVEVVSDHYLSIVSSESFTSDDQVAVMRFELEVSDHILLEKLLTKVRSVSGVFDAVQI